MRHLLTVWVLLLSINVVAEPFSGLGDEMTPEERAQAGLDSLTPAQLDYLNGWLQRRFDTSAPEAAAVTDPDSDLATPSGSGSEDVPRNQVTEAEIEAEVERRVAAELAAVEAAEVAAEEQKEAPFEAVITNNFTGWNGKSVFVLDNGQVWRQRSGSSRYRHTRGDNTVRFKRSFLGLWTMTVVSTGRAVGVRRID